MLFLFVSSSHVELYNVCSRLLGGLDFGVLTFFRLIQVFVGSRTLLHRTVVPLAKWTSWAHFLLAPEKSMVSVGVFLLVHIGPASAVLVCLAFEGCMGFTCFRLFLVFCSLWWVFLPSLVGVY